MSSVSSLSRASSPAASAAAADSVRHDDSRLSDARTPVTHTHAGADVTSGLIGTARLPLVFSPPNTLTYAATVTPDATLGDSIKITATGALTINVPTGGVDGQNLVIEVLASGANRVVTLNASIALTTGQATTFTIVSAKVGLLGFRFSALASNVWICTSMTQML